MKHILLYLFAFGVSAAAAQKHTTAQNIEYIDWSTAKINGKVSMESGVEVLYSVLGKPDSIVKPNMDDVCTSYYDNKPFKYVYIKECKFELYGKKAVMCVLDFKNSALKLTAGKLVLDKNTTLAALTKVYPNAVKESFPINLGHSEKTTAVRLAMGKIPSDDSWLLFFENGKLIRIDYHMPC